MDTTRKYKVVEMFESINGEGQTAGELAFFVRFAGCNLQCSYCDTAWANAQDVEYEWLDSRTIIDRILTSGIHRVTLTGGEPLLQEGIGDLLEAFSEYPDLSVEIETNGSVDIAPFIRYSNRPAFTLDYKLPASKMEKSMRVENYQYLTLQDTLKFVVSDEQDLVRAKEIMDQYELYGKCGLYLSPVYKSIEPSVIVEYMKRHCMNQVHIQLQLHKYIWNPEQRGV